MDIRIKATNFTLNDSVSAYLDERLATITRHLGSEADNARLEVEVGRDAGHSQHVGPLVRNATRLARSS